MNDIVIFRTGSVRAAPAFNRPQSGRHAAEEEEGGIRRAIAAGTVMLQMHA
jgi:hypothetical protein